MVWAKAALGAGKELLIRVEVAEWWTLPSTRKEYRAKMAEFEKASQQRRIGYPCRVQA